MSGRVLLASPRSFCAGVERAIAIVERALDDYGAPVYVRRHIVHNSHVVDSLEAKGAVFVQELDEVPVGMVVVLSAHGVAPSVLDEARARSLHVINAVCPLVAKVHQEAKRYARDGYDILLIGHAEHEEVIGTVGEAPGQIRVVAPESMRLPVLRTDPAGNTGTGRPVVWLSQTTLAVHDVTETVSRLRAAIPDLTDPPGDDICFASQNRQAAVQIIAPRSDVVLIAGSPTSSNSMRLVEVARDAGAAAAYLVDQMDELRDEWLDGARTVGVSAGASAPEKIVRHILDWLAERGFSDVEDHSAGVETVQFDLPGTTRRNPEEERNSQVPPGREPGSTPRPVAGGTHDRTA